MPDREEFEQLLDEQFVIGMRVDARKHGWTQDEYEKMLRMEASKARGDEHHVDA